MLEQILLGAALPAAAAIGFLVKRQLERRPELDALEISQRLLAIRKDLEAQGLSATDLDAFSRTLLGVATTPASKPTSDFTARRVGPWVLISALATSFWWITAATHIIAFPTPELSIQVVYLSTVVFNTCLYISITFILAFLWLATLIFGPLRFAA